MPRRFVIDPVTATSFIGRQQVEPVTASPAPGQASTTMQAWPGQASGSASIGGQEDEGLPVWAWVAIGLGLPALVGGAIYIAKS